MKTQPLSRSEWIRRFESVHGRGKYDHSKLPDEMRIRNKIEIYCPEHDITFRQSINQHYIRKEGCPKCGVKKRIESQQKHIIKRHEFIKLARAIHGNAYEYYELPRQFSLHDEIIIYDNTKERVVFCRAGEHANL